MLLPALILPFQLLFSHGNGENATDPEKEPQAAASERNGTGDEFQSPQSPLNAYDLPSQIRYNPRNRPPSIRTGEHLTRATTNSRTPMEAPISHSQNGGVRALPLISGVFVPFSILLAVPGLTEHWYIRTDSQHKIVEFEANPVHLQVMLGFSMACAIITNACLIVRLFEKMVKKMTIVCIVALTIHDILDTIVLIMFIIKTQKDDGFSLGQAFWMTLCSTFASLVTNVTLILDYQRTSGFERHRSGLTEKQRSLTIIIIVLLCYVAFGAAVHTPLLSLSFIDALYFTVVCIETVGFGDIDPQTPGARIFSSLYTTVGILILAVAIGLIREALLEAIQLNLHARILRSRKHRIMKRWTGAVKWRLENVRLPVWVPVDEDEDVEWPREMETRNGGWKGFCNRWSHLVKWRRHSRHSNDEEIELTPRHRGRRMRLNLRALSEAQLRAAAMEAGAPLQELLPHHYEDNLDHCLDGGSEVISPTHHRIGHMSSVIRNFAFAVSLGQTPSKAADGEETPSDHGIRSRMEGREESSGGLTLVELEREERRRFAIRISIALGLFFTFWLVGSAIFTVTEKWSFGLALYFCFVTFSTVGYGDPVPRTPAGRSFFVGWALCGIATVTILISLLADRYSERYKTMIFAAESTVINEGGNAGSPAFPSSRVGSSDQRATEGEKNTSIPGKGGDVWSNEDVVSRLDSLRAIIVGEEPHKEEKLLHTLEDELQSMLLLIRRSRKRPSRDE